MSKALRLCVPVLVLVLAPVLVPTSARAAPGAAPVKIDLLFVVDDSASMGEEQASLAANFPRFMDELAALPGGLPDLHVAVISTDTGVGRGDLPSCTFDGDDGRFQHEARVAGCVAPSDAFLIDAPGAEDESLAARTHNYPGTLGEAFACIAQLGTNGCGFEQPLASIERALAASNTANAGFLRADAFLAVVVISDEDDCSASDPALFAPGDGGDVGPLASFRCTRFGVTCAGAPVGDSPGPRTDCTPAFASPYLTDPAHTVEFLRGLKSDPAQVLVAAIVGDASHVEITTDFMGGAQLAPACQSSGGVADPAVRTSWFAAQFAPAGGAPDVRSICADDLSGALGHIGASFRGAIVAQGDAAAPVAARGCSVGASPGGPVSLGALALVVLALALARRRLSSRA